MNLHEQGQQKEDGEKLALVLTEANVNIARALGSIETRLFMKYN